MRLTQKHFWIQQIRLVGVWVIFGLSSCLVAQNPKAKKQLDEAFMAYNAAEFPKALSLSLIHI
jgi:hypothetical protein